MHLQANLKIIEERFPHLLQGIKKAAAEPDAQVIVTSSRSGLPVAQVSNGERRLYLNSSYDPELEAERWVEKLVKSDLSALVLCGSGFFYQIKAILASGTYKKVVCYEPSWTILRAALDELDLREVLSRKDFLLIAGGAHQANHGILLNFLEQRATDIQAQVLPGYQEIFRERISEFQKLLKDSISFLITNFATLHQTGELWAKNAVLNLPTVLSSPGIKHFFGRFAGVPAVIVNSGPSLEKNIQLLPAIKNRALIICSGSSIRAMRKHGVSPHILLAYDGNLANQEIYSGIDLQGIMLCFNHRFYQPALQSFTGPKIHMRLLSERFTELITAKSGYDYGDIYGGFTVAHSSLDLAFRLGCDPIIITGQDLAFTNDKRYADGQAATAQVFIDRSKLPPGGFITKDLNGREIVTDKMFEKMRRLMEQQIEVNYHGKVSIINATEGGVPIAGTINRSLADVIEEYCREERGISQRLTGLYQTGQREIQKCKAKMGQIPSEIEKMTARALAGLEGLTLQVLELQNRYQAGEKDRLAEAMERVITGYQQTFKAREYEYLLHEMKNGKLTAINQKFAELREDQENAAFERKLQYCLEVFAETRKYLEIIRENNQSNLAEFKTGEQDSETSLLIQDIIHSLERAVRSSPDSPEVWFRLFRLYQNEQNISKQIQCLNECYRLGYRQGFCRKKIIKLYYQAQNYPMVNNLIVEHSASLKPEVFYSILKIKALQILKLIDEAEAERSKLSEPQGRRWAKVIQDPVRELTEFEIRYNSNHRFFKERGLELPSFAKVRYQIVKYLENDLIYDAQIHQFIVGVKDSTISNFSFTPGETLLVANTDDHQVFAGLERALENAKDPVFQRQIAGTPLYIVEQNIEQWQLLLQNYDFNKLSGWLNIHFIISPNLEELEAALLADEAPLPTSLYGTGLDDIRQSLERVKEMKERLYQERMERLGNYYRNYHPESIHKILIVSTIKDDCLDHYGRELQTYLTDAGYKCLLYHESAPYFSFTKYADARLLDDFHPDLVIHLFALQEELGVFSSLKIPFCHWQLVNKSLYLMTPVENWEERIFISGNPLSMKEFLSRKYREEQICRIPLPTIFNKNQPGISGAIENRLCIINDLGNSDIILKDIGKTIKPMVQSGQNSIATFENIEKALQNVYFTFYTKLTTQTKLELEDGFYLQAIRNSFEKCNLIVDDKKADLIKFRLKKELEPVLQRLVQVKWLTNELPSEGLFIYGKGWETEPSLQSCYQGDLDFWNEPLRYQQVVLESKVNIYIGPRIKNNSLQQPDLVNGIVAGGFFLAYDGNPNSEEGKSFGNLLETYQSKDELVQKVRYYLENETERWMKAEKLREYVITHLSMDKVVKTILTRTKEIYLTETNYH